MKSVKVQCGAECYQCTEWTKGKDRERVLAVPRAWKAYVRAIGGLHKQAKAPQVPVAFSQILCCIEAGLLENKSGHGVDAFRRDRNGKLERIEIKCTTNDNGRNDILLYDRGVSGISTELSPKRYFDFLYWVRCDRNLTGYEIYRIPYKDVRRWVNKAQRKVRGGRVGVSLSKIVEEAGIDWDHSALF